jgi:DtxR family Mn-dependent transcriptional regulator
MRQTESAQNYVKAIYSLVESGEEVSTTALANRLSVSPASVTAMVKRLAHQGLLAHQRYQGFQLTDKGREVALEVIRHHRLIEAYLCHSLGITWDRVHDEAEVLEHAISEELEDRIDELLGHPTHDPHGDPIPPKMGEYVEVRHPSLDSFPPGPAVIRRVSDRDPEALRYLSELGLVPGTHITVENHGPFGGPVWVGVRDRHVAIGRELASTISVSEPEPMRPGA